MAHQRRHGEMMGNHWATQTKRRPKLPGNRNKQDASKKSHPSAAYANQEAPWESHRCPNCGIAKRPSPAHLFGECQHHAQHWDHHLRAVQVSSYEVWIRRVTGSVDSDRVILDSLSSFAKKRRS
ncbi:uncharacterized protein LOC142587502 [Dermacentor variabilis]|uniref:uncharacterized protein LOC142587502 n=1 Tax=Dermacentor variabilis TaxID=34621 RepID=UPI003F5BC957